MSTMIQIKPEPLAYQISEFTIDKFELYWLAGILEGEGSFRDRSSGTRPYPTPVILCCSTDEDVIVHAAKLMGANQYRFEPKHGGLGKKPIYRLEIYGLRAQAIMLVLKPLMGSRRQAQIESALNGYDGPHRYGEKHKNAKLTNNEAIELKRLWKTHNYTQKQLGTMFGISEQNAGRIGRGDRWKWIEK